MAPLRDARTVTLDGAGNGAVQLGPVPTFHSWRIERITVQATGGTGTSQATCYVWRGDAGGYLETSTYAGNLDNAGGNPISLQPGEFLTVQWVGGRPGAIATARLSGELL